MNNSTIFTGVIVMGCISILIMLTILGGIVSISNQIVTTTTSEVRDGVFYDGITHKAVGCVEGYKWEYKFYSLEGRNNPKSQTYNVCTPVN